MKFPPLPTVLLAGLATFGSTGCAVLTQGQKQAVVVRSSPSGAVAKINGTVVGQTPFKVKLSRDEVYRIDFEKNGFTQESALLLPSTYEYNKRYLRWGLDYQFGAASELIPSELAVELKPTLGDTTQADRYAEMTAQVVRADAMLASGELSKEDHKYLIGKIVETFQNR